MNQTRLDLYSDYLTVTPGYATATGLSHTWMAVSAMMRLAVEKEARFIQKESI